jgi:chemotaxis protein CheX
MNEGVKPDAQQRWAMLMDETVAEVFDAMLGTACVPTQQADAPPPKISARVDFSGAVLGAFTVTLSDGDAVKLAEMLLAGAADDAMAADAVGELCNVLAGTWKRRLKPPASSAGLSVPALQRGADDGPSDQSDVRQGYDFASARLVVRLSLTALEEE